MKAVFLSDAHLFNEDENGYKNLLEFFSSIGDDIDELYVVGDFFDFWFCTSDNLYPGFRVMIDSLLEINNKGVKIFLFEGNHDFFLEDFFYRYGIDVYPEDATIKFNGMRLFIAHGDTVDTSNKRYLLLRRFLRSRIFYNLQSILPRRVLWKIAEISSKISKEHLAEPPEGMADKMEAFSFSKFKDGFDAVILGHCHKPQIKQVLVNGRMRTFVTLGDWISHFSYLLYDNGHFSIKNYSESLKIQH